MSNAVWVPWRIPCSGLRSSSVLPPVTFRHARRDLRITPCRLYNGTPARLFSSFNTLSRTGLRQTPLPLLSQCFAPASILNRFKKTIASAQPERKPSESLPGEKPLSDAKIKNIFGRPGISAKLGNRVLAVLHARRLEGTLDLDLPTDITLAVSQDQLEAGLEWLREKYPIDEDAAILARIEREEREAEQKWVRRAEELGLYKPQSGSYEAEHGEENSPHGKSVLKEIREQNEKRLLAEKERKRQEWLAGEAEERERLQRQVEGHTALQQYQESALTEGMYCWKYVCEV